MPLHPAELSPRLLALGALAAGCSRNGAELGDIRPELGDFRLCYNIVTTNDAVQGPLSRAADLDVFADHLRDEIDRRFGRYEGDRLYHLAINIDAYVLAVPGIPLVASPRSALILSTNLWDDQLGRPLNEEPEQFTVLESASGGSSARLGPDAERRPANAAPVAQRRAAASRTGWSTTPSGSSHPGDMPETRETTTRRPRRSANPPPLTTATGTGSRPVARRRGRRRARGAPQPAKSATPGTPRPTADFSGANRR